MINNNVEIKHYCIDCDSSGYGIVCRCYGKGDVIASKEEALKIALKKTRSFLDGKTVRGEVPKGSCGIQVIQQA